MNTSQFVKESRKSFHLTQAKFADLIGKKRLNIVHYENNRAIPPGDVVLRIIDLRFPGLLSSSNEHISDKTGNQGIKIQKFPTDLLDFEGINPRCQKQ